MSGASVWCGPLLVGVVVSDITAFNSGRLAAEPATRLLAVPAFRELIGEDAAIEAVELVDRKLHLGVPGPAYLLRAEAATVRFRSRSRELTRLARWCHVT